MGSSEKRITGAETGRNKLLAPEEEGRAPETLGQRDQYVLPGSTRKKYLYFIQLSWT